MSICLLRIIYAAADMYQCSISVTAITPQTKATWKVLTWFTPPPPVFTVNMEAGLRPSLWRSAAYRLALRGLLILLS